MKKQKSPWKVLETRDIYKNHWMHVFEDSVIRPDGNPGIFGYIRMQPGVSILAITDDNKIIIEQEYRYSLEHDSLELPSGGIEDGATPLETAKKELQEETGYSASDWEYVGPVEPLTSTVHAPQHLFIANGLQKGKPKLEGTEVITAHELPFDKVYQMVLDGRITHSPTVVLILRAKLMGLFD